MFNKLKTIVKDLYTELQIDLGIIPQPPVLLQPIRIDETKLKRVRRKR